MILVSQQWVAGSEEVMEQPTFSDVEYEGKKRKTRREMFLERMEGLIPWPQLEERVRPLSQGGPRAASLRVAGDAAGPLCAAFLQSQRPGHGGPALRG